jgi:CSLREA domain-containing protein
MRIVRPSLASAVLGLLLATTLPAVAATFTVNSTVDAVDATPGDGACATAAGACTLRAAVMEANVLPGNDVVTLPSGTFRLAPTGRDEDLGLTGDLDVLESMEMYGAGSDDTIIDGFGADRILDVVGSHTLTLGELTLKRGSVGGAEGGAIRHPGFGPLTITNVRFERNMATTGAAIRHGDGPLTITGCDFNANISGYPGGAVNKTGVGALSISASTFTSNSGDGAGGAVAFDGSEAVSIADSRFLANTGYSGGSVSINAAASVAVSNSTFEDSQSSGNGGALSYTGPGDTVLSGVTVVGALAGGSGGAIYVDADGSLTVTASTFTDCASGYSGGGLSYNSEAGGLTLLDDTFEGNGAFGGQGGGLHVNAGGPLDFHSVKMRNNFSDGGGGGVLVYNVASAWMVGVRVLDNVTNGNAGGGMYAYVAGPAKVEDSVFSGNATGDGDGGGLQLTGDGPFELHRSTFATNTAAGTEASGGGLLLASGEQALILNCTFSGNACGDEGGGLYAASDTKVWNSTFVGNTANTAGGAIFNASQVRVANTILAAGTAGGNCAGNDFISGNRNMDTDGTCQLDGPSDQEGVDPQLGPLADNGGLSPTHALAHSSPAIDNGNASICSEVDQRGLPRPADGNGDGNPVCDIGAYEFSDQCPGDPNKIDPGACGCGNVETDDNANGVIDCLVNAEVKARIARALTILDSLDGQRSAEEKARRSDLKGVAGSLGQYVADHQGALILTDPNASTKKLLKAIKKSVKGVLRARGGALSGARDKAETALDALDQLLSAD